MSKNFMGIASAAALALALSACGSRTDTANSADATMANDTAGFDAANAGAQELPKPVKALMRASAKVMTTTARYI